MVDKAPDDPKPESSPPEPSENRWGPNLVENQYKSLQHSFDLPPWDELIEEEKEKIRNGKDD